MKIFDFSLVCMAYITGKVFNFSKTLTHSFIIRKWGHGVIYLIIVKELKIFFSKLCGSVQSVCCCDESVKCLQSDLTVAGAGTEQVVTFRLETNGTCPTPSTTSTTTIISLHSLTCIVRVENTSPSFVEKLNFTDQRTDVSIIINLNLNKNLYRRN